MVVADRYEVIGNSLVGGMAVVLPCIDNVLERKVAIKVLPGGAEQRRVRDELGALLKMRSKHVVQVYDILLINGDDLAIVQEFIEGNDLFDNSTAPTTANSYLKLIWQIASGIADIHDLDIIHRDIKPNNMKVDPEGVVKIFDFGLAREEGPAAATIGFVGTHGFAAPELYDEDVKFSPAVDAYAFGATALFIAVRDLPAELKQAPPAPLPEMYFDKLPHKIADELVRILRACLNPNPVERPLMQDVRDLLAKHLLRDRHKALIVFQGQSSHLDASHRSVSLRLPSLGDVEIHYDGFSYYVHKVSGDVYINNRRVTVGDVLPGACVVTLGAPEHQNQRRYVTFDLSHPEIVL